MIKILLLVVAFSTIQSPAAPVEGMSVQDVAVNESVSVEGNPIEGNPIPEYFEAVKPSLKRLAFYKYLEFILREAVDYANDNQISFFSNQYKADPQMDEISYLMRGMIAEGLNLIIVDEKTLNEYNSSKKQSEQSSSWVENFISQSIDFYSLYEKYTSVDIDIIACNQGLSLIHLMRLKTDEKIPAENKARLISEFKESLKCNVAGHTLEAILEMRDQFANPDDLPKRTTELLRMELSEECKKEILCFLEPFAKVLIEECGSVSIARDHMSFYNTLDNIPDFILRSLQGKFDYNLLYIPGSKCSISNAIRLFCDLINLIKPDRAKLHAVEPDLDGNDIEVHFGISGANTYKAWEMIKVIVDIIEKHHGAIEELS